MRALLANSRAAVCSPTPAPLRSHQHHRTNMVVAHAKDPHQPARPTATTASEATATACVLLPGVDRQQLAQKAEALEAAAAAAHKAAQQLNKEGRYEEAKVRYAEMRRLDAEALTITRQLGCQQCMITSTSTPTATDGGGGGDVSSSSNISSSSSGLASVHEQLHQPTPWPSAEQQQQHLQGRHHQHDQQQQQQLSMADRARGAMVACLVCDAAATGVQWIYDLDTLQQLQQQRDAGQSTTTQPSGLEFYSPVQSPFLTGYSSGRNSPYGEQTLLLLQSLAQQQGLDCRAYAQAYYEAYSSGEGGFDGYMNASTVAFLRTYGRGMRPPATGAPDDAQADCIARAAPLVAAFAGDPRLLLLTAGVTRVTQDSDVAVAWACAAAAVLELLLMGWGVGEAMGEVVGQLRAWGIGAQGGGGGEGGGGEGGEGGTGAADRSWPVDPQLARQVAEQLQRVLELRDTPHAAAVEELGRNCHLPNSCQTPLHAVLHHMHKWQQQQQQQSGEGGDGGCGGSASQEKKEAKQQVLVAAVRDALAAGGCCASRASYVGACMGAVLGLDALPEEWLHTKYEASGRVCSWADAVCDSRR